MSSAQDKSTTVHGFALSDPKGKFEPYTYHPRPLGDDDVEVKIEFCGICGSDIHTAFGGWGHVDYPIIVGHEIVGTASAVGKNVKHIKVGDRVGCGAQCGCCHNKEGKKCRGCPDNENHCNVHNIGTYAGKYNDGERSQGGYADLKRFDADFAFQIPDNLPSDVAAPLLCAGATVYSPLARYGAAKGKKVGVVGIGGLGHLAVQFAHKMGAEVIAIGHSPNKAEQAKQLGAKAYITIDDEKAMDEHWSSIDIMIIAANGKDMPYDKYMSLCKLDSHFCLVGLPEDELSVKPFPLVQTRTHITGSSIGSTKEIKEMLEFASKHDVKPWIERLPMSQVNEGIRKVKENDVKFRVVLEVGK